MSESQTGAGNGEPEKFENLKIRKLENFKTWKPENFENIKNDPWDMLNNFCFHASIGNLNTKSEVSLPTR